jgi:hypothetical protein
LSVPRVSCLLGPDEVSDLSPAFKNFC